MADETNASELSSSIKSWQLLRAEVHIFDLKNVSVISKDCLKQITNFYTQLKKINKTLVSINTRTSLKKEISAIGLDTVFNPINDTKDLRLIISKAKKRSE